MSPSFLAALHVRIAYVPGLHRISDGKENTPKTNTFRWGIDCFSTCLPMPLSSSSGPGTDTWRAAQPSHSDCFKGRLGRLAGHLGVADCGGDAAVSFRRCVFVLLFGSAEDAFHSTLQALCLVLDHPRAAFDRTFGRRAHAAEQVLRATED